jgi:hypothetical protein
MSWATGLMISCTHEIYGAASLGARHRCYAWKASSMRVSRIGCLASIVISVVLSVILTVILNLII